MNLSATWSCGASSRSNLDIRDRGSLLRRCLMRRASAPRCQQAAAMPTASSYKQHVCHAGGSLRILMLRRGTQPLGRSLDQPPPLSSFEQQELPAHSRILHEAHLHAAFALETAVEQAQEMIYQAPIWLHAFVSSLLEAMGQSMARFMTWASSHSRSTEAQAVPHATGLQQHTATAAVGAKSTLQASASPQAVAYAAPSGPHTGRQMHCSVQAAVGFSPSAMVLSCGVPHKVALVVALLLALVLPRLWKRHWEEVDEMRQIQELVEMNGVHLQRQKHRFQQALQVDSINLELPDIKDVPVDLSKAVIAVQHNSDAMREQWESFMVASKIGQVKDVWDAHDQADTGAPRATKKQLEEMTARVRAASSSVSEASKRHYVSFEELCGEDDDFDAGMANRVAQRKARFQGQFLSDEDVGLPAPKRQNAPPGSRPAAGAGSAPGNGRLGRGSDAGRMDGSAPSPRRRAGWEEGRVRPAPSGAGDAGTSFDGSAPLLEIRPKKALRGGAGGRSQRGALGVLVACAQGSPWQASGGRRRCEQVQRRREQGGSGACRAHRQGEDGAVTARG